MQQDAINRHIDAIANALEAQGYRLGMSADPEAYKAYVATLPGYSISMPLDPARVELDGNFIWITVTDHAGDFVGIETGRVVHAPRWRNGLARLIDSQEFLAEKRLKPFSVPHPVQLYGRLLYLGGALVNPRHRGRGIMSLLVKLTLAHQCRLHDLDGCFAWVRSPHIGLALSHQGYGFAGAAEVPDTYWGSARPELFYLVYSEKAAIERRWQMEPKYTIKEGAYA
ncbi:hypothetical protein [Ferrovibrio sp.]|uniref:hypothetical protein n=1 Tax=Ferrovibrio sp. TaxID=1917215 RepID=UPI0035B0422C